MMGTGMALVPARVMVPVNVQSLVSATHRVMGKGMAPVPARVMAPAKVTMIPQTMVPKGITARGGGSTR